jgi:hypothetical protein
MTTDPTELYPVISQIAVAFAGFGSLASGLRRRRGADDAKLDAFRLFSMLQVSITTTILGLVGGAASLRGGGGAGRPPRPWRSSPTGLRSR